MPSTSIITPLYNGRRHIGDCLASVQAQSFADYEHLVIDNGSTDGGAEIVREMAASDDRISLLAQTAIKGAGPTRNAGIEAASGRYMTFLDCDDSWRPSKLERQIGAMESRGLHFSWSAYQVVDATGAPLRVQACDPAICYGDLLFKRTVIGCLTAAYDTDRLGKRYMNDLPMRQDFCLWLDIIQAADAKGLRYGGIPEILADYRAHDAGMTSNKPRAARMQWRAYREHAGLGRGATAAAFASYAARAVASRLPSPFASKRR